MQPAAATFWTSESVKGPCLPRQFTKHLPVRAIVKQLRTLGSVSDGMIILPSRLLGSWNGAPTAKNEVWPEAAHAARKFWFWLGNSMVLPLASLRICGRRTNTVAPLLLSEKRYALLLRVEGFRALCVFYRLLLSSAWSVGTRYFCCCSRVRSTVCYC